MRVHRPVFGRAVIKVSDPITASRLACDDASGMTVYDYVVVLVAVLFVHNFIAFVWSQCWLPHQVSAAIGVFVLHIGSLSRW